MTFIFYGYFTLCHLHAGVTKTVILRSACPTCPFKSESEEDSVVLLELFTFFIIAIYGHISGNRIYSIAI